MPQGKLKNKTKVPDNIKNKNKSKGKAFTRRSNAPIQAKKSKFLEQQKLKQIVSKNVNKTMEEEMRARAEQNTHKNKTINLSKAQEAVAKHHKDKFMDT